MKIDDLTRHQPKRVARPHLKHEAMVARTHGAVLVKGSGCTENHKGDAKTPARVTSKFPVLIEAKYREKFSKTWQELMQKVTKEASAVGRFPVLQIQINELKHVENDWVMIPASFFHQLMEAANETDQ